MVLAHCLETGWFGSQSTVEWPGSSRRCDDSCSNCLSRRDPLTVDSNFFYSSLFTKLVATQTTTTITGHFGAEGNIFLLAYLLTYLPAYSPFLKSTVDSIKL